MSAAAGALNGAAISVLVGRDVKRFFRQKSRIAGALAQPLIFWGVFSSGLAKTFQVPGAERVGYAEYFYPGVVVMIVLFAAIFTTISVIEDRKEGFLRVVLAGPASRGAVVAGKTGGSTAVAAIQAALLVALAPLAGFSLLRVDWPLLVLMLLLSAACLSAAGFVMAWWLNSTQGYHAVMSVVLIPLWVLSGAMFPASGSQPWMTALMRLNPVSYAVDGVRRAMAGGSIPDALALPGSSALVDVAVVASVTVLALAVATWRCSRKTTP